MTHQPSCRHAHGRTPTTSDASWIPRTAWMRSHARSAKDRWIKVIVIPGRRALKKNGQGEPGRGRFGQARKSLWVRRGSRRGSNDFPMVSHLQQTSPPAMLLEASWSAARSSRPGGKRCREVVLGRDSTPWRLAAPCQIGSPSCCVPHALRHHRDAGLGRQQPERSPPAQAKSQRGWVSILETEAPLTLLLERAPLSVGWGELASL